MMLKVILNSFEELYFSLVKAENNNVPDTLFEISNLLFNTFYNLIKIKNPQVQIILSVSRQL